MSSEKDNGTTKMTTYERIVQAKKQFPDYTNKQIADSVKCNVVSVRKHLSRARKNGDLSM